VDDHHITGACLVRLDRNLKLTPWARRAAEYLVRYHKGRVPEVGADEILCDGDRRRQAQTLLGFLRAADALDSRRAWPTALIMRNSSQKLRIRCLIDGDVEAVRQRLKGRSKFELLENRLNLRVRVRFSPATNASVQAVL